MPVNSRRCLPVVLLAVVSACSVAGYDHYRGIYVEPLANTQKITWDIAAGASFGSIVADLERAGLIRDNRLLPMRLHMTLHAKMRGLEHSLKAGSYTLETNVTPASFFDLAIRGDETMQRLFVVEGATLRQVLRTMRQHDAIRNIAADADDLRRRLDVAAPSLEGWFFPDTYFFHGGDSDVELFRRGYQRMKQTLEAEWRARAPQSALASPYEALILASIIEKEAGRADERARIAGVFMARLERNMRMQADPTVIYGIGEGFDGNLSRTDLKTDTPYNTYLHTGLPPTPIAMPGLASLRAALHPDKTGDLYFVAKGDGSHHFSATYEEHRKAVARFQRR